MVIQPIWLAASSGPCKSRAMARLSTRPAAVACIRRQARKVSKVGATRHPRVASAKTRKAVSSTGRRPKRSESGPKTSCSSPMTPRYSVTASCITA